MTSTTPAQQPWIPGEDIPLSAEEAVAALRWGAAAEDAPYGASEDAVDAVRRMTPGPDGRVALDDVLRLIREHVADPGTVIHGWAQGHGSNPVSYGTYWALDDAVAMAREPGATCCWTEGSYYHDLSITTADGQTVRFHAFCPYRNPARQDKLLAEIAVYMAAPAREKNEREKL